MEGLFQQTCEFDNDVYRNIVSLRASEDLFDDLAGHDPLISELLLATEMRIKQESMPGVITRGFHYSTAIAYPFSSETCMRSRYGDSSYGVWYGSLQLDTTIYETAWHMYQDESCIEGLDEVIIRERVIYLVHCKAILFDLMDKHKDFPQLIDNNYNFTHQVGKRLQQEGHPGLLAPSARRQKGSNVAIFNPDVLHNACQQCYLTYRFDPNKPSISIEKILDKEYIRIQY